MRIWIASRHDELGLQRVTDGPPKYSFEFAKEMIAGIAGFEADKLIETK